MGSVFVHVSQVTAPIVPNRAIQDGSRLLLVRLLPSSSGTNVELRGTNILRTKTVWSFDYTDRENHSLEFVLSEQISPRKREEIARLQIPFSWLSPNEVVRETFHMKPIGSAKDLCIRIFLEIHLNENESEPFEAPLAMVKPREQVTVSFDDSFVTQEFNLIQSEPPSSEVPLELPEVPTQPLSTPQEENREELSDSSSSSDEIQVIPPPVEVHEAVLAPPVELLEDAPPTEELASPIEEVVSTQQIESIPPVEQEDDPFVLETTSGEKISWMALANAQSPKAPASQITTNLPNPYELPPSPTSSPEITAFPIETGPSISFYPTPEQMRMAYIAPCPLSVDIFPLDQVTF